jgi:hypothetical protein
MRKLVFMGLFLACLGVVPSAIACDDQETEVVTLSSTAAIQQSRTFLADATRLDRQADIEEAASSTERANAKARRRKAATIRAQAFQIEEPSRGALLAMADRLNADAALDDADASTYLSRARTIRARARALRALSTRVLTTGAVTAQVLPRVQLPAPPSGHPDPGAFTILAAAPSAPPRRMMAVARL